MMMIKKLKMWRNPGYTEECIEVPPVGSRKLPAPDWVNQNNGTFYDLRPRKNSTLSKIELPISFSETWDMSYLWMSAEDDAGTIEVFGWIRSVEQIAGSEEAVRIMWVPDYWRTCSGSVTFGKGVITKTSNSTYARPTHIKARKISATIAPYNLKPSSTIYGGTCVIFTFKNASGDIRYGITANIIRFQSTTLTGIGYDKADSIATLTGINSDDILGCWLCSYPPIEGSYWNSSNQLQLVYQLATDAKSHTVDGITYYWAEFSAPINSYIGFVLTNPVETTDEFIFRVCDQYGTPYLTLPWGLTIKSVIVAVDVGVTEAYYEVLLTTDELTDLTNNGLKTYINTNRYRAINEGTFVNIPITPLAVSSSKLSDYYVSGQRDFEIESRRIENEKALASGITGAAGSALSGALTGAIVGSSAGPVGAAAGAAIGLGVSLGSSIIGNEINKTANDQLQKATEELYANQAGNLISIGCTNERIFGNLQHYYLLLVKLLMDSTTRAELSTYNTNQGYDVEIPVAAATSFMTTGPLQIRNLNVTGSVPPAAKTAIKTKLEAGVYIVENNSTGTDPAI